MCEVGGSSQRARDCLANSTFQPLGCFLEYYGSDVDDFDDSVSLSSCPSDYTSGDDFVSSESEGHAMHDE